MNRNEGKKGILVFLYILLGVVLLGMCVLCGIGSFFLFSKDTDDEARKPSPSPSFITKQQKAEGYTIMLYMLGSNLETDSGLATENLERLGKVPYSESVNVLIEAGGALKWHNPTMTDERVGRYKLSEGRVDTLDMLGRKNMVDPDTLTDFINWSAENYPAEHYMLLLWDHGGGIPMGFGYDEMYPYDAMSAYEIGEAIRSSKVHPDIVLFDACLMSTIEVAYALAGTSDYMIASEETMYATYTLLDDIVSLAVEYPERAPQEIACMVVDNYMEEVDADNGLDVIPTNLSVIDLAKMNAVEAALHTYMTGCKDNILNGDLRNYLRARNSCGGFTDVDTVDAISFARHYDTVGADAFVSAVEDAVLYTRGNIVYANGLSMYAPSIDFMDAYTDAGRDLFLDLGARAEVAFFDTMYSAMLNYSFSDVADAKESEWYDDTVFDAYEEDAENYSDTFAGASFSEAKEDVLIIPYYRNGDHYSLDLHESDWDIIDTVETNAGYYCEEDGSSYVISLGSDNIWTYEEDGYNLDISFPESWLCMDGQIVEYVVMNEYSDDEGNWSTYGAVLAALNGDYSTLIYIVPYWSSDNPDPVILGYYRVDPDTLEYKDGDSYLYPLTPGDVFEFVYEVTEFDPEDDTQIDNKYTVGPEHTVTEAGLAVYYDYTSNFLDLFEDTELVGFSWITITDIYGNVFETEVLFEDE